MKYYISIGLIFITINAFSQNDSVLSQFSKKQLIEDYDLMVSSLKEAHTGLYWYTSPSSYEEIFQQHRDKIYEGMNSYEFFRILCSVTAADKEGHSNANPSKEVSNYYRTKGKFLPIGVKVVNKKLFVINNINFKRTRGNVIKSINGIAIDSILREIFRHKSSLSDGFTTTGKFNSINRYSFSSNYFDYVYDFKKEKLSVTLLDTLTNLENTLSVNLVSRDSLLSIGKTTPRTEIEKNEKLFKFKIHQNTKIAVMGFSTFSYNAYARKNLNFKSVVDSLFLVIKKHKIKKLIIDIRNNSGGTEGAEDYLYSHLTKRAYTKYEYVEVKSLKFSFINQTDYKDNTESLYSMLKGEHYLSNDGRFLRKKNVLPTELPKKKPFKGDLYILISGRTYSGGSEFASIAKSHNRALFVGEETGGGFYGQTSGSYIYLTLPNTQNKVRIPLLKFFTSFKSNDIPFGRGVIPDYKITQTFEDYINNVDSQMEFTLNLIKD
ncbi:S41 family peptidase [uncultured Croceitalea sp.]|uniref:S41 family peptidase n=1 Tax=uncultured Croceitalea sp. TaxID=1798908 RepID=UPI0033066F36